MNKIAIVGAGGFGIEVACLIEDINKKNYQWEIVGFFDDVKIGETINDYKVLGGINDLKKVDEKMSLAIAIGWPKPRKKIVENILNPKLNFPALIHPSVMMSRFAEIGDGSIICAGSIITVNIKIGKFVIINVDCTIGHEAVIKDYCSLMPSVNVSGEAEVGTGSFLGTNSLVINRKKIGDNSIIGAGAVVIDDVPNNCTAVGNPAKVVKINKKNAE